MVAPSTRDIMHRLGIRESVAQGINALAEARADAHNWGERVELQDPQDPAGAPRFVVDGPAERANWVDSGLRGGVRAAEVCPGVRRPNRRRASGPEPWGKFLSWMCF
jgi:hypothetical protein